ncbi:MAG: hypothetical protein LUQ20_09160, partial [Candidatus Methanoperedens sp.]|nr:hypothetical protein [Candidatus Methanoperedens sp.]
SENKIKSSTSFSEWMNSIGKKELKDELNKHLIPNGDWRIDNFKDFLKERRRLIEAQFNYV